MKTTPTFRLSALLVALIVGSFAHAQDKVILSLKGKEGLFGRYTSETAISLDFGGEKMNIVAKETTKSTVTKVASDGTLTIEHKQESSEQTFNGESMPDDSKGSVSTDVVRPNGTLVSLKEDSDEVDPEHLNVRIWLSQAPVFSDKAVGVGDQWKHTYQADGNLGSKAAEATFHWVSTEDVGTSKCAKVVMDYRESGASPTLNSKVTMWIELVSGDVVKAEFQLEGIPFPGPSGNVLATAKGTTSRVSGGPVPESGPQAAADPEPKKIEDVTKGCEKLPGILTIYKKREAGRQTIYAEIKKSQLGSLLMLQATASSGTAKQVVTGSPIGDIVFRFEELQPDKVTIVVPNFGFRAEAGTEADRAVQRSFANSFIEQYNVEARSKERESLLIDVSDLFRGDIARLSNSFQGGGPFSGLGGSSYSLDREKTFVSQIKVFPDNLVVESQYNLTGSGAPTIEDMLGAGGKGDPRSISIKVLYNLFALKDGPGYRPRHYDSRVGYFTVWFQDFTKPSKLDQQIQYITRWNVRKKDPQDPVSEPEKPIVFWIDNAVPKPYRAPIEAGLLVWNKAFEKIGIKDAIVVKQMPDDADWDPADMRYNTVRWVASPEDAYAVAQHRINPITGETMSGSILIDANMVRALTGEQDAVIDPSNKSQQSRIDPKTCTFVQDGMHQAQIGMIASSVLGFDNRISSEEYVRQFIQNVTSHEFGHMLGLRHNFAASTQLTLDQLKQPSVANTAQPSASVMDYVPFNVSAIGNKGVEYYGLGLGSYDYWAIQYGYSDFGKDSTDSERPELKKLASQCNEPGLAYQTDENADGFDPYVTRFDLGAEPIDYWTRMIGLTKSLVSTLGSRKPLRGESYFTLTRELQALIGIQARSNSELVRFVGGIRRNENYKGDKGERGALVPVDFATQRKALALVCSHGLSPQAYAIPKSYLTQLADNPNANLVESMMSGQNPFPIFDIVARIQAGTLNQLMSPGQLSLVVNNEFKSPMGSNPLTVGEVYETVQAAVWTELKPNAIVTPLRRELQRNHLQILVSHMNKPSSGLPSDAKMWAWSGLRHLADRLALASQQTGDKATQVHFEDCMVRIHRALSAVETLGGSSPQRVSLADLIGG